MWNFQIGQVRLLVVICEGGVTSRSYGGLILAFNATPLHHDIFVEKLGIDLGAPLAICDSSSLLMGCQQEGPHMVPYGQEKMTRKLCIYVRMTCMNMCMAHMDGVHLYTWHTRVSCTSV